MDLQDSHIDSLIKESLYASTNLAAQRKQAAWKRLRARASQQTPLPPLDLYDRPQSMIACLFGAKGILHVWLTRFAIDESRYERARQSRYRLRYSAILTGPGLPNRLIEPFCYHFMTPVF